MLGNYHIMKQSASLYIMIRGLEWCSFLVLYIVIIPRWVCGEVSSHCSFIKTAVSLQESEEFPTYSHPWRGKV